MATRDAMDSLRNLDIRATLAWSRSLARPSQTPRDRMAEDLEYISSILGCRKGNVGRTEVACARALAMSRLIRARVPGSRDVGRLEPALRAL